MIFIIMMLCGALLVAWELYQSIWVVPQILKEIKDAKDRAAVIRRTGRVPERHRQGPVQ